jgi:ribosomal protein S18 acetylase RimI-like enzyme
MKLETPGSGGNGDSGLLMDEGHIGTFAVHPDFRRQGIGQKLLAQKGWKAGREGVRKVFLEVRRAIWLRSSFTASLDLLIRVFDRVIIEILEKTRC